ncbi:MAG: hypothetical protein LBT02_04370 [Rickettsiales bacterium]|jgi:hypothetical protein|nr:hypothetical protein [Rickettsiales bacterium]
MDDEKSVLQKILMFLNKKIIKRTIGVIFLVFLFVTQSDVNFKNFFNDKKKEKGKFQIIPQNAILKEHFEVEKREREEMNRMVQRELNENQKKEKKEMDAKQLKEEFTDKAIAKSKKIKVGDLLKIKVLVLNGDDFNTIVQKPMIFTLMVSKKDVFTKDLIGKKIGNVVTTPIRQMLQGYDLDEEVRKMQEITPELQTQEVRDVLKRTNYKKLILESQMLYKVKAVEYAKKIEDPVFQK